MHNFCPSIRQGRTLQDSHFAAACTNVGSGPHTAVRERERGAKPKPPAPAGSWRRGGEGGVDPERRFFLNCGDAEVVVRGVSGEPRSFSRGGVPRERESTAWAVAECGTPLAAGGKRRCMRETQVSRDSVAKEQAASPPVHPTMSSSPREAGVWRAGGSRAIALASGVPC
jgi:hypothetical protein